MNNSTEKNHHFVFLLTLSEEDLVHVQLPCTSKSTCTDFISVHMKKTKKKEENDNNCAFFCSRIKH